MDNLGTMMTGIYDVTLMARDGREKGMFAYLPTEETKRVLYERARRNGLGIVVKNIDSNI